MRINVLQHTPNEGPGAIAQWAALHHHSLYIYHPYQFPQALPSMYMTDFLILLGGPMNPLDNFPWLAQERQLIAAAIKQHCPLLGICLGAQQLALTLGGQVQKAPVKEVGWGQVVRQTTRITSLPAKLEVLHWHEDMFTLPPQAQLLFSNHNLTNQGFLWQDYVVGLQFHLEPLADNLREIVVNDAAYISGSIFQQSAAEIIQHPIPQINQTALFAILDYLTSNH
ncbi:Glutamine amidotransferase class-I [Bombilactobacillus mellifer]|uniref:Glutamine amidotransferase class-I n=1 Tax=Bombilactobacillus mellifer TaxID=1218492 RepID=A0A0F4LR31_9LACO|nr:type 1 glutamine amidotransferase [Bombilactobacillus mellifer]KJY60783.1 Glutamine amidotransferase class-I [Bombilactobacillus mellifer]